MSMLDHWHPVLQSHHVGSKPVSIKLGGQEIVLFRTQSNEVGALKDRCAHRGMRLSQGWVEGEQLICSYHAWSYDRDGKGFSPGTPKLQPCTPCFETIERHGMIWIKSSQSIAPFPDLKTEDYHHICTLQHWVKVPLELVLDNFSEVEHTATTHTFLGYGRDQMAQVEVQVEATNNTIEVRNKGPQKPLPWILEQILDIRTGDWFVDNWVTYFSPVYTIYEQYWVNSKTGKPHQQQLRIAVFFNPIDESTTELVTFAFSTGLWGKVGFQLLVKPLMHRLIDYEIKQDQKMLEQLADKRVTLEGTQLGRFDRVLVENRRRINRIYRGIEG